MNRFICWKYAKQFQKFTVNNYFYCNTVRCLSTKDSFVSELVEGLQSGKRACLARAITLVESTHPKKILQAQDLLTRVLAMEQQTASTKKQTFRIGKLKLLEFYKDNISLIKMLFVQDYLCITLTFKQIISNIMHTYTYIKCDYIYMSQ